MPISSTLDIYTRFTLVILAIVYPWVYIVLFLAVLLYCSLAAYRVVSRGEECTVLGCCDQSEPARENTGEMVNDHRLESGMEAWENYPIVACL